MGTGCIGGASSIPVTLTASSGSLGTKSKKFGIISFRYQSGAASGRYALLSLS